MYFAFSRELSSGTTNHCDYARCTAFRSLRVSWNFTTWYIYIYIHILDLYIYTHIYTHTYMHRIFLVFTEIVNWPPNSIRFRNADEELFYIYGTYCYQIRSPNVSGNVSLEEHKKSVTLTTTKIQIESRFEWTVTANRASAKSFTVWWIHGSFVGRELGSHGRVVACHKRRLCSCVRQAHSLLFFSYIGLSNRLT